MMLALFCYWSCYLHYFRYDLVVVFTLTLTYSSHIVPVMIIKVLFNAYTQIQ